MMRPKKAKIEEQDFWVSKKRKKSTFIISFFTNIFFFSIIGVLGYIVISSYFNYSSDQTNDYKTAIWNTDNIFLIDGTTMSHTLNNNSVLMILVYLGIALSIVAVIFTLVRMIMYGLANRKILMTVAFGQWLSSIFFLIIFLLLLGWANIVVLILNLENRHQWTMDDYANLGTTQKIFFQIYQIFINPQDGSSVPYAMYPELYDPLKVHPSKSNPNLVTFISKLSLGFIVINILLYLTSSLAVFGMVRNFFIRSHIASVEKFTTLRVKNGVPYTTLLNSKQVENIATDPYLNKLKSRRARKKQDKSEPEENNLFSLIAKNSNIPLANSRQRINNPQLGANGINNHQQQPNRNPLLNGLLPNRNLSFTNAPGVRNLASRQGLNNHPPGLPNNQTQQLRQPLPLNGQTLQSLSPQAQPNQTQQLRPPLPNGNVGPTQQVPNNQTQQLRQPLHLNGQTLQSLSPQAQPNQTQQLRPPLPNGNVGPTQQVPNNQTQQLRQPLHLNGQTLQSLSPQAQPNQTQQLRPPLPNGNVGPTQQVPNNQTQQLRQPLNSIRQPQQPFDGTRTQQFNRVNPSVNAKLAQDEEVSLNTNEKRDMLMQSETMSSKKRNLIFLPCYNQDYIFREFSRQLHAKIGFKQVSPTVDMYRVVLVDHSIPYENKEEAAYLIKLAYEEARKKYLSGKMNMTNSIQYAINKTKLINQYDTLKM